MRAKKISENIDFKRGNPHKTLRIGKYGGDQGPIKMALLHSTEDQMNMHIYLDVLLEFLEENPILIKELELGGDIESQLDKIYGFEIDSFVEENPEYNHSDFKRDFMREYLKTDPDSGLSVFKGKTMGGSTVIYYLGGLVSGFMSKVGWLK